MEEIYSGPIIFCRIINLLRNSLWEAYLYIASLNPPHNGATRMLRVEYLTRFLQCKEEASLRGGLR